MGTMFRSEEMALCQLFIQPEAAYLSASELGETGTVQFRDLNGDISYFQRKFVNEVRRCDEMERKLRYIEAEMKKDEMPIPSILDLKDLPRAPNPREIINLEARIEKTEHDILELSQNSVNLKSTYLELMELCHVLEKTQSIFTENQESLLVLYQQEEAIDSITRALMSEENVTDRGRLEFVAGVINRERIPAFERMLWRISRGNIFLRQVALDKPLEDPTTGNEIYKTAFVAFYQGEQLKSRIKKICTGFHAALHPCPSTSAKRLDMAKSVRAKLEDLNIVMNQTQDHRHRVLHSVSKELPQWTIMVRKIKAIYHTMNLFSMDVSKKCLIGECWVPIADLNLLQKCLAEGSHLSGSTVPSFLNVIQSNEEPPIFNRTNKFTRGFQILIDAYGVASYREVNPALYTIVTFPFLFSVMFGDIGHGLIMALFGLYMVLREKKLMAKRSNNEIWNIFFGGRYIILMMGGFSIYTGFIYNDLFSKSINIFQSYWKVPDEYTFKFVNSSAQLMIDPKTGYYQHPYPFGMDPVWMLATNKIIFLNSFKMKLSIMIGVAHMMFGVCVNTINFMYFKKYSSLILEFIPQLLLLILLFGYMVFLMVFKWIAYSASNKGTWSESCAPSVLITFINMMLFGKPKDVPNCEGYMFPGQNTLQMTFVGISLGCILLLLLGKPLYLLCTRTSSRGKVHTNGTSVPQEFELEISNGARRPSKAPPSNHEDDEPFSEIMIHQAIHTIEYALSTISHTASYLRLWALSLAHAQLSEVLWNMVLGKILQIGVIIPYYIAPAIFFAFGAWAFFTMAILVLMEGLSAFLHTLRLHWVEFMSKFYQGQGYPFQPFYFKTILDAEEASEEE